jgi:hypothetical protein
MSRTYGDLGATYGTNASRTYGTLFDDAAPTSGLVALFARVQNTEVAARVTITSVSARITTSSIDYQIN